MNIEKFLEIATRVAYTRRLHLPRFAYWNCRDFSEAVHQLAQELGFPAELISTQVQFKEELGEIERGEWVDHTLVRIDGVYYDWTARQFDPKSNFPRVMNSLPPAYRAPVRIRPVRDEGVNFWLKHLRKEASGDPAGQPVTTASKAATPEYFFGRIDLTDFQHTYKGSDPDIFNIGRHRSGHPYTFLPHRIELFIARHGTPDFIHVITSARGPALKAVYAERGREMIRLWDYVNIRQEPGWKAFEKAAHDAGYRVRVFHQGQIRDSQGYWLASRVRADSTAGIEKVELVAEFAKTPTAREIRDLENFIQEKSEFNPLGSRNVGATVTLEFYLDPKDRYNYPKAGIPSLDAAIRNYQLENPSRILQFKIQRVPYSAPKGPIEFELYSVGEDWNRKKLFDELHLHNAIMLAGANILQYTFDEAVSVVATYENRPVAWLIISEEPEDKAPELAYLQRFVHPAFRGRNLSLAMAKLAMPEFREIYPQRTQLTGQNLAADLKALWSTTL